jgi:hypothetical protein
MPSSKRRQRPLALARQQLLHRLERRLQPPLVVRLAQDSERIAEAVLRRVGGRVQHGDATRRGLGRQVDPAAFAGQHDVAQHQVDAALGRVLVTVTILGQFALKDRQRADAIHRGHHRVAGVGDHGFIVERDQRLVLDDEDALDVRSRALANSILASL